MTWDDVLKIVVTTVGGVGGIMGALYAVIRFSAARIAERLSKKYEMQLNKELEDFKSNLEKKNYVSRIRFDSEFEIYKQLSETFLQMVFDCSNLFSREVEWCSFIQEKKKERLISNYHKARLSYNSANRAMMQNAPFVPTNMYVLFEDLRNECLVQIDWFSDNVLTAMDKEDIKDLTESHNACLDRHINISEKLDLLIEKLRLYLATLDVADK